MRLSSIFYYSYSIFPHKSISDKGLRNIRRGYIEDSGYILDIAWSLGGVGLCRLIPQTIPVQISFLKMAT